MLINGWKEGIIGRKRANEVAMVQRGNKSVRGVEAYAALIRRVQVFKTK